MQPTATLHQSEFSVQSPESGGLPDPPGSQRGKGAGVQLVLSFFDIIGQ